MEKALGQAIFYMIMKGNFNIIKYGHFGKKTNILKGSGNAGLTNFRRTFSNKTFAVQHNRPLTRCIYPCQKVKGCRFSGAVWSDQTNQTSLFNIHIQIIYGTKAAEGDPQVFNFQ